MASLKYLAIFLVICGSFQSLQGMPMKGDEVRPVLISSGGNPGSEATRSESSSASGGPIFDCERKATDECMLDPDMARCYDRSVRDCMRPYMDECRRSAEEQCRGDSNGYRCQQDYYRTAGCMYPPIGAPPSGPSGEDARREEECMAEAARTCSDPGCRDDIIRRCMDRNPPPPRPPVDRAGDGASDEANRALYSACAMATEMMCDSMGGDRDMCMEEHQMKCMMIAGRCAMEADMACSNMDMNQKMDCMKVNLHDCLPRHLSQDGGDSRPVPPVDQGAFDACVRASKMVCEGKPTDGERDECMEMQEKTCRCAQHAMDMTACVDMANLDMDQQMKCQRIMQDCLPMAMGPDGGSSPMGSASDEAMDALGDACAMAGKIMCEEKSMMNDATCMVDSGKKCYMAALPCATKADMGCMQMNSAEKMTCMKDTLHQCLPAVLSSMHGMMGKPDPTPAHRVMKDMERRTFDSACMLSSALICMPRDMERDCMMRMEKKCKDTVNRFLREAEMEMGMGGDDDMMRPPYYPDGGDKPDMGGDDNYGQMDSSDEDDDDDDMMPGDGNTDDARTDRGDGHTGSTGGHTGGGNTGSTGGHTGGGNSESPMRPPTEIQTNGGGSSSMGSRCALPGGSSSWACNFNSDLCDTENDMSAEQTWMRGESTPSGGTGPDSVYDGSFIYIETSADNPYNVRMGDRARIMVPVNCDNSDSSTEVCVSMNYNMRGQHMGKLAVITKHSNGDMAESWAMEGDKGTAWHEMQKTLTLVRGDKVYVSGEKKDGHQGDAAVDNLSMRLGPC